MRPSDPEAYSYESVPDLLRPAEAAEILKLSTSTLASWRSSKNGKLPYIKIGSKVFYTRKDVCDFIQKRRVL